MGNSNVRLLDLTLETTIAILYVLSCGFLLIQMEAILCRTQKSPGDKSKMKKARMPLSQSGGDPLPLGDLPYTMHKKKAISH